jgi:hypothetical protein
LVEILKSGKGILPVCFDRLEACPTDSKHPAEHGIDFNVIVAASHSHEREIFKAVFPFANLAKGTVKIAEKCGVATAIFESGRGENEGLEFKL